MAQQTSNQSGKPKGWFSRKHATPAEHTAARDAYKAEHGPAARKRKAAERASVAVQNAEMAKAIETQVADDTPPERTEQGFLSKAEERRYAFTHPKVPDVDGGEDATE